MPSDHELLNLLQLPDDALYQQVAKDVLNREGETPAQARNSVQVWLRSQADVFRELLCNNPRVQEFLRRETEGANLLELLKIVADILAHHFVGFPPFALSALLAKGIRAFCDK